MATDRCRSVASLGITRGFPRLCPTAGLVAVALLTLAPLALRLVRLACLIHAANVHSEPGSNPSKSYDMSPPKPLRHRYRHQTFFDLPKSLLDLKGLRKNTIYQTRGRRHELFRPETSPSPVKITATAASDVWKTVSRRLASPGYDCPPPDSLKGRLDVSALYRDASVLASALKLDQQNSTINRIIKEHEEIVRAIRRRRPACYVVTTPHAGHPNSFHLVDVP